MRACKSCPSFSCHASKENSASYTVTPLLTPLHITCLTNRKSINKSGPGFGYGFIMALAVSQADVANGERSSEAS